MQLMKVSMLQPVNNMTATGGKTMLHTAMVRRFAIGMRAMLTTVVGRERGVRGVVDGAVSLSNQ